MLTEKLSPFLVRGSIRFGNDRVAVYERQLGSIREDGRKLEV